jgi:hypothetical protein
MDAARTKTEDLFDVVRRIVAASTDTDVITLPLQDRLFLREYLKDPDTMLQFQCRKIGERPDGEPIYQSHYAMAGKELELFMLFTEASAMNPMFARLIEITHRYLTEHVPNCPECNSYHQPDRNCHWPDDVDPDRFQFQSPTQTPSK